MPLTVILNGLLLCYGIAALALFLYGINCYIMIFLHRRSRARMLQYDACVRKAWESTESALPHVTIQLPIYNECYVIQRLIEAVVCLRYPRDRLQIQVLDDSTDGTTAIAARLVQHYRQAGFDMVLRHRQHRQGYKAGALKEGLAIAKGAFVAIFDADFVPDADFLQQTLPFFQDPGVAMVQGRWGHVNRDYSPLTLAQSFGIDGHFWVEQSARCWSGLFMNFNGSGGIWRRQAIDDAGGWQADTLTEDLDLSYRAQLRGWRLKFVPHVVCPAEIPVQISSLKNQQHRWAKGSIQTAKKIIPQILKAEKLPLFTRCQAILHLTNYLVHPFMLLVVLTAPMLLWFDPLIFSQTYGLVAVGFSLATFGPSSMYLYAQHGLYPDWKRRLLYFPFLLIFGTGIALNNTRAILEGCFNIRSAFVRTPKFRIEKPSDTWIGKRYRTPFPWFSLGEALLAVYCVCGVFFSMLRRMSLIDPFLVLYAAGFASVAFLNFREYIQRRGDGQDRPRTLPGGRSVAFRSKSPSRRVIASTVTTKRRSTS